MRLSNYKQSLKNRRIVTGDGRLLVYLALIGGILGPNVGCFGGPLGYQVSCVWSYDSGAACAAIGVTLITGVVDSVRDSPTHLI